ncbi:transposase [Streptomyces sp. NPDC048663]|uniref:transposase n=1 Tax=Streptomyces sp. NPDC048663 TaxID=3155638 RepID=UPI00343E69A3
MGSKYTKRYTEEFKRDAIALVDSSGKTVTAVARDLGISSESLRGWYRRAKADRGEGAPGELTTAEREELRRLRRQNIEQIKTIKVLRKAAVFSRRRAIGERLVRVHRGGEDHPWRRFPLQVAEGCPLFLLRLARRG